jgi:hypothetical protein
MSGRNLMDGGFVPIEAIPEKSAHATLWPYLKRQAATVGHPMRLLPRFGLAHGGVGEGRVHSFRFCREGRTRNNIYNVPDVTGRERRLLDAEKARNRCLLWVPGLLWRHSSPAKPPHGVQMLAPSLGGSPPRGEFSYAKAEGKQKGGAREDAALRVTEKS